MDALRRFWDSIPAALRTIINVALGAAFAAAVSYLTGVVSGGAFDLNALVEVVLTAIGTAVVRALNPADAIYGFGSTPDATGAHEADAQLPPVD